jgi:hypothetical protein
MIIENREKLVRLTRVPEILAAICEDGSLAPSLATVRRWAAKGRRGVVLETIFMGQRQFTSRPAIARFIAAISEKQQRGTNASRRPSDATGVAVQAIEAAVRQILARHGIHAPSNAVTASCAHGPASNDQARAT